MSIAFSLQKLSFIISEYILLDWSGSWFRPYLFLAGLIQQQTPWSLSSWHNSLLSQPIEAKFIPIYWKIGPLPLYASVTVTVQPVYTMLFTSLHMLEKPFFFFLNGNYFLHIFQSCFCKIPNRIRLSDYDHYTKHVWWNTFIFNRKIFKFP